jgi:mono/diheme cytochrome c family protein
MKKTFFTMLIALLATLTASAAGDATAGKATYNKYCKSCHGTDGQHNPNIAKVMKVEMKDLGSSDVQSMSDADLKKPITDGMGKMKPIKSISGADLDNVIAYIRTFKK